MTSESLSHPNDNAAASRIPLPTGIVIAVSLLVVASTALFLWSRAVGPSDGVLIEHGAGAPLGGGLAVAEVHPEREGGLKAGDMVTAIDGRSMESWAGELSPFGSGHEAGENENTATYTVVRDGEIVEVSVERRAYGLWSRLADVWGIAVATLAFFLVSAFVFLKRPSVPAARALMLFGAGAIGSMPFSLGVQASDFTHGFTFWNQYVASIISYPLIFSAMLHFWLVFPEPMAAVQRRPWFVPTVYAVPYAGHAVFLAVTWFQSSSLLRWMVQPAWDLDVYVAIYSMLVLALMVWRFRTSLDPVGRRQVRWVVTSFLVLLLSSTILGLIPQFVRGEPFIDYNVQAMLGLPLPLAIAAAVLRYRLFDIDLVVSRTIAYGILTAIIVGIYLAMVGGVGALFHSEGNVVLSLVGAGVVAIIFHPLRKWLQRGVNRLLFGAWDDPYAVVSQVGQNLEKTSTSETILSTMVETIARALKLRYVAISSGTGDDAVLLAEFGAPTDDVGSFPLTYQGETVGQMLVGPRDFPREPDRLLLGQAGVVVHSVQLTNDLQRSRGQLIAAREEERRRIRRDLHDGIGPTLASITMRLDAVRNLLSRDPEAADAALDVLKSETQNAIVDIRRLVYELRPPALDELGLVGAIREHAAALSGSHDGNDNMIRASVEAPEALPDLPAAVEVAAYRIALEALTNTVKHSGARFCTIRISGEGPDTLRLEIADDGAGLPGSYDAGVGMMSMRERASELGGSWDIQSPTSGGTLVTARLPIGNGRANANVTKDSNSGPN